MATYDAPDIDIVSFVLENGGGDQDSPVNPRALVEEASPAI